MIVEILLTTIYIVGLIGTVMHVLDAFVDKQYSNKQLFIGELIIMLMTAII